MRLFDRFAATSQRALPEGLYSTSGYVLAQTYRSSDAEPILPTFSAYASEGYQGNGIVFATILARLQLFSEATFKFRDVTTKRLFGTEALQILENPWPGGTTGELLARMEQDVSLAGNAFVRYDDDNGVLVRLRPDWVDIVRVRGNDAAPMVAGYLYHVGGHHSDQAEFYAVDEVAHWTPIPDPLASFRGMSWLTPVVREINADLSMTEYKRNYFNQGATPNGLLKFQQKLGDGAVDRISAMWQQRYGGPDGWKTAVLDQGADYQVIGNSMDQIRFTDVQAAGENRIAAAGGVPGIVIGLKEGLDAATYSNYAMAMRRFADLTMRPNWRSACAALSKLVAVPEGATLWYDTTDISALREGEQERAATMQTLASAASTLLMAGYEAESITAALSASDMTLLRHTGLLSVQLQAPGAEDGNQARDLSVAEAIQKVYLGVGKIITADEAREIVNTFGYHLPVPGPLAPGGVLPDTPEGGSNA